MSHLSIGERKIYKVFLSCSIFLLPKHLRRETVHKSSSLLFRMAKWPKWWPLLYNALRLGFLTIIILQKNATWQSYIARDQSKSNINSWFGIKKDEPGSTLQYCNVEPHEYNTCEWCSYIFSRKSQVAHVFSSIVVEQAKVLHLILLKLDAITSGWMEDPLQTENRHHNKRGEQKNVEIMVQDTYQTGVCEQWHLHLAWCQLSTLLVAAMLRHFLEPCELVLLLTMNSALQTTHDQHHKLLMIVKHIN